MPFSVGPMELVVVLVIALVVLGPKRLPEMGRSLGKGLRQFKDSVSGIDSLMTMSEPETSSESAAESKPAQPKRAEPSDSRTPLA